MTLPAKTLTEKLKQIDALLLDVDGVMTDGRIFIDANGLETKAFNVRDGHGISMLRAAGIVVGMVSGRKSRVVDARAKELGIREDSFQGVKDKPAVVRRILERHAIFPERAAFMGDDVVDLAAMDFAGMAITVADANDEVKSRADMITEKKGGKGAVREVCEAILKAKGLWGKNFAPKQC